MKGRVLVAPQYANIDGPLIFLAGPIQGARDWQQDAVGVIHDIDDGVNIANPRRAAESYVKASFTNEHRFEQYDWETHHLRRAGARPRGLRKLLASVCPPYARRFGGCILFYLAREQEHLCERAYAQTTRFELAEWKLRHERDGTPIALGIEDGFSGARYLRRRFAQDCPGIRIRSTLEDVCRDAIALARAYK